MPISKDKRHHYRGENWKQARAAALKRAGDRCLWCRKPNHTEVFQVMGPRYIWAGEVAGDIRFYDELGLPVRMPLEEEVQFWAAAKSVKVVLTTAHLNHQEGDDRDENLASLCQRCHCRHDAQQHAQNAKRTRRMKQAQAQPSLPL